MPSPACTRLHTFYEKNLPGPQSPGVKLSKPATGNTPNNTLSLDGVRSRPSCCSSWSITASPMLIPSMYGPIHWQVTSHETISDTQRSFIFSHLQSSDITLGWTVFWGIGTDRHEWPCRFVSPLLYVSSSSSQSLKRKWGFVDIHSLVSISRCCSICRVYVAIVWWRTTPIFCVSIPDVLQIQRHRL